MAIKRLGAQRFSGLDADVNNLPLDADLTGAIFNSTDTLKFWIFNGTSWNESAGGGGITGLEPNSTILEYSTEIADYTTPTSATATSPTATPIINNNGGSDQTVQVGDNSPNGVMVATTNSVLFGVEVSNVSFFLKKVGLPTGTATIGVWSDTDTGAVRTLVHTFGTIDVSTLTTTTTKYSFTTGSHIMALNDTIGLLFDGGDGSNRVIMDGTATDVFDGTDTIRNRFSASWSPVPTHDTRFEVNSVGGALEAIDGDTATFWASDSLANQSITLDMGSVQNCYGLAYYISTAELTAMTETQFQIKTQELTKIFEDNFNEYANQTAADLSWTANSPPNPQVNLSNEVLDFDFSTDATNLGVAHDLVTPLGDFVMTCKVNFSTLTQNTASIFDICVGDMDQTIPNGTNQDAVGIRIDNISGAEGFWVLSADGENLISGDSADDFQSFDFVTGTDYFIRLTKAGTVYTAEVDTSSSFPSPTVSTVSEGKTTAGLQYVKLVNHTTANTGSIIGTVDNVLITLPDTFTTLQTLRTINTSDLVPDVYNFIRFNGVNIQFITVEGSSGSSLVMAANELAVQVESDPPLTTLHGQFTINGTADLPLNGGDPTSSVIDDPSTNSMTLVSAAEQSDPPTDGMVMWNEVLDVNNSVSHSKMKIDGAVKNVRWF